MKKLALVFFALAVSVDALHAADQGQSAPQAESKTLTIQEAVRLALSRSPEVLLAETQAGRNSGLEPSPGFHRHRARIQ
jgi:hypothetical protein